MRYVSTRGKAPAVSAAEALLAGQAPDGGLFVPEVFPRLPGGVEALVGLGFAQKQAEEATDKVLADDPEATTSGALRAALSMLGKK